MLRDNTLEKTIINSVVTAAEAMVVKGGLDQLSMRALAMETGNSLNKINSVFKSQDDLILHIKAKTLDELDERMGQIRNSYPEQYLEELVKVYVGFARQNPSRWRMVFEHRFPKEIETPDWYKKKVENIFRKFEVQFAIIAPELVPAQLKQTTLAFWGGVHGICLFNLISKIGGLTEEDFEESINLHVKHFIHNNWINMTGTQAFIKCHDLFYKNKLVVH